MKPSDRYHRFVYWSEEDQCYVGSCPDLCGPCCHGDDEAAVYRDLCQIVEEHLRLSTEDDRLMPPARTRSMPELAVAA